VRKVEVAFVVAVLSAFACHERAFVAVGFGKGDAAVGVLEDVQRAAVVGRPRDVVRVDAAFGR